MKQNSSLLLPVLAFAIGMFVVVDSALAGNYSQLALGVILVVASVAVFKHNVQAVETDMARKLQAKLGLSSE